MIRRAVLLFLASVSWVLPAFPQATYYLVDNSGSMTSYREGENGVDREVEGLIRGSPAGSEVYVQFSRERHDGLRKPCFCPTNLFWCRTISRWIPEAPAAVR